MNADASRMMRALGDPMRQTIFERLSDGPLAVGELAADLPVSRPAVSQHLKVLKDVGLIVDRAEGTRRLYQVDRGGLAILRTYLDHFWDRALLSFQAATDEDQE